MKYRKKPVVIDAIQWTGSNFKEVCDFISSRAMHVDNGSLIIETLEGDMKASFGDYIIRGVKGEYYPCKPDIFEDTYERVED